MVRPDEPSPSQGESGSRRIGLAGESPAAASAGEPRSRPRVRDESPSPERGVEGRQGTVGSLRREPSCGPQCESVKLAASREIQPKGGMAEPLMSRRRQQTAPSTGSVQDIPGVRSEARSDSPMRNRRDPTQRPESGRSASDKPMAKRERAGRESEGLVVLVTATTTTSLEGRGPALVTRHRRGKCEGMTARSNNPIGKARKLAMPLYVLAERRWMMDTTRLPERGRRSDDRTCRRGRSHWMSMCMPDVKTIGKPCAGKSQARFERGPQVVGPQNPVT